ncbi:folylpolyglutamate synthase, mitochondrial-like isoform X2 [Gordionus sp. m RMFG-2023]|uniref:folylpolyglutamate synthase, mitochondrial-like isoform X2 n=1 Tax=Gordionus sp. m RMFG-2023 TaxID=3053472 RepID=UPI0031FD7FC8
MQKRCVINLKNKVFKFYARSMHHGYSGDYEEAVKCLNELQTNKDVLKEIRRNSDAYALFNIPKVKHFIKLLNIQMEDIDALPIIHVSGTKGKGTTCAFTERILRNHGFKTGLFTSPHMLTVSERIKINGQPLSADKFCTYFWPIYERLRNSENINNGLVPSFFQFLTCMAFSVFMQEKVDVAIFEVGIGGQYDSTNIVRKPIVCGITSIGIDHVIVLGDTHSKIAWHKAGIIKPKVPVFTVMQPPDAMKVLMRRAHDNRSELKICPPLHNYDQFPASEKIKLRLKGAVYRINASLAIQLAHTFLQNDKVDVDDIPVLGPIFPLSAEYKSALEDCYLDGRSQIIKRGNTRFYLDGAHTLSSIKYSLKWFQKMSSTFSKHDRDPAFVLVFNCTEDRDAAVLLKPLLNFPFTRVVFSPSIEDNSLTKKETLNSMSSFQDQLDICANNKRLWVALETLDFDRNHKKNHDILMNGFGGKHIKKSESNGYLDDSSNFYSSTDEEMSEFDDLMNKKTVFNPMDKIYSHTNATPIIVDCVKKAMESIQNPSKETHVYVTGSLYLVATFLKILKDETKI